MRKVLHDELSCVTMKVMNTEDWSSNKIMMNPKRSEINSNTFTTMGRTCLKRALLETERRFFGNTVEETFEDSIEYCDMSSSKA